jgi:ATP-dependent RNA helicase DDX24/MAK5
MYPLVRFAVEYFAQYKGRTLVFANAVSVVRRIAAVAKLLQLPVVSLHAQMEQRARLRALERFRADPHCILIVRKSPSR